MVEIGVRLRKVVIFTVKGCYRSICNHPFLVGMLCLLMLLYRSFPFLFSILVTASPVLVCTAILLGTLLSFGQTNIPEFEKEERTTHEIVSLKTEFVADSVVVESNESCSVERFSDKGSDVVEKSSEERSLVVDGISKVGNDDSFTCSGQPIDESSREIQFDDRFGQESHRELHGFDHEQRNELEVRLGDRRSAENQYSLLTEVDDENRELENDRSPVGSVDSKVVNVDSLDSPPGSPWKHLDEGEGEEEGDEDDDEASDSGSDRAESSSPDASMADIIPMLDELHPLLDEDVPQPANLCHDGSDAASESSARSNESGNDTENQTEFEVGDDDNEDGDEEEETQGDKEDETKSAITWTEEDQRNLMELGSSELERNRRLENLIARRRAEGIAMTDDNDDGDDEEETQGEKEDQTKSAITWTEEDQRNLMELGSSEIERNQRLEKLIARRRARKTMSVVNENLIDLESADPPFNLPPIATTRTNPFDLPNDSYENMGLPPIPGSAPSILLPWRNPFDLPYDSSEEKPDLMEDSFQQEFMPLQSKEALFRRHESFNVRPSLFGTKRVEKQDIRLRPYFVPERIASEGTSYFPLHRQSSEVSDSKASSVPDTESVGSDGDSEERNATEEDISVAEVMKDIAQEPELISMIEGVKNREDISHEPELISMVEEVKNHTEEDRSQEPERTSVIEEVRNNSEEEDISREPELISMIENAPEHIGHGSESSEDEDSLKLVHAKKRHEEVDETEINLRDVEYHHDKDINLVAELNGSDRVEGNSTDIPSNAEDVEQKYGGVTSSSSVSEEIGKIYAEKVSEVSPSFVEGRDHIEEPSISTQQSVQGLHLDIPTALTDDTPHKEPVYDLSPSTVRKNLSSSSISSDLIVESETGLPPVVVKRTVSFAERESEARSQDIDNDTPVDKEMLAASSQINPVDKSELDITKHDVIPINREMLPGSSAAHSADENEMKSMGEVEISEDGIVKYDLSAVDEISESATASVILETDLHRTSTDANSSIDTSRNENLLHEDVTSEHARSIDSETHVSVPDTNTVQSVSRPSEEKNLAGLEREQHSENVEAGLSVQLDSLSTSSQSTDRRTQGEAVRSEQGIVESNSDSQHHEANQMLSSSNHQNPLSEMSVSPSNEKLVLEPSITMVESVQEVSNTHNPNTTEVRELELSLDRDIPTSLESITVPFEVYETQAPADEEMNEIDEIDEELLSELDTVGDFRVKEVRELDHHVEFGGSNFSVQPKPKFLTGLVQRISTQAHRAKYDVHTEILGAAIKETNKSDEDMKRVSQPETSGTSSAEKIDSKQYDQREVDTNDLESSTTKASKEKEVDVAANILEHKLDTAETNANVPEIEVRSVKDIESTPAENEIVLKNPEPSLVETSLRETAAEIVGAAIKETNKSDEDMKLVSEPETSETSAAEKIDSKQYDQREVDTIDLESSTTKASKEKEADVAANVLERKPDTAETNPNMPETEMQSVNHIESKPADNEIVLKNPEPSLVETSLRETAARCSEDSEASKASSQSKVKMETPNVEEKTLLDLNQPPGENVEQIPISDSVINAVQSKDKEGTSAELHVSDRAPPNDINLAMKQASESSPKTDSNLEASESSTKDESKSSEIGSARDVANQVESSKKVKSDVTETAQFASERPDCEVKTSEGRDVATSLDVNSKNDNSSKTSSS